MRPVREYNTINFRALFPRMVLTQHSGLPPAKEIRCLPHASAKGKTYDSLLCTGGLRGFIPGGRELLLYTGSIFAAGGQVPPGFNRRRSCLFEASQSTNCPLTRCAMRPIYISHIPRAVTGVTANFSFATRTVGDRHTAPARRKSKRVAKKLAQAEEDDQPASPAPDPAPSSNHDLSADHDSDFELTPTEVQLPNEDPGARSDSLTPPPTVALRTKKAHPKRKPQPRKRVISDATLSDNSDANSEPPAKKKKHAKEVLTETEKVDLKKHKLLLNIPRALELGKQRVEFTHATPFSVAQAVIHSTIGCTDFNRKPSAVQKIAEEVAWESNSACTDAHETMREMDLLKAVHAQMVVLWWSKPSTSLTASPAPCPQITGKSFTVPGNPWKALTVLLNDYLTIYHASPLANGG
ncbi:hypothetical protein B0H17DRAFT_1123997 [Mycena rosella]|uniref:Uncharacterized protein n=1 Tax=Mycena rosella TaxID=1033263 RepID=A0AAD7MCY6_MYCRO|nr:hypothetical protein B0H17DRAFT_1123997 [Mycena rosella]